MTRQINAPSLQRRGPIFDYLLATGLAVGLVLISWGCGLATGGLPGAGGGDAGTMPNCNSDSDCQFACQTGTCGADKVCSLKPLNNVVSRVQKAGDCKKVICVKGEPVTQADPSDVPPSADPCTTNACVGETVKATQLPDGDTCTVAGSSGLCAAGKCKFSCKTSTDCPVRGPCSTPTCNIGTGTCDYQNVQDGTLTPNLKPVAGDCRVHECLNGVDTALVDTADIPVTSNDCVAPLCRDGGPNLLNVSSDTRCATLDGDGGAGYCSGSGACVECTKASECFAASTTDNCQQRPCTGFACGNYPGTDTVATSYQAVAPACHKAVCDGKGGRQFVVDTTNVPSNPCATTSCDNSGNVVSVPLGTTVKCGANGAVCDGKGNCGCTVTSDCAGISSCDTCGAGSVVGVCVCTPKTCAGLGLTCGTSASACDNCGTALNCNNGIKDTHETDVDCGGNNGCSQTCDNGKACKGDGDCTSKHCILGMCCDTAGCGGCMTCVGALSGKSDGQCAPALNGSDPNNACNPQTTCGLDGQCDGKGNCRNYVLGTACGAQCDATITNQLDTSICDGKGACTAASPTGCGGYLCKNAACPNSCTGSGDCAAGYYCKSNKCTLDVAAGQSCTGADTCAGGFPCVGGYCCSSACSSTCHTCAQGSGACTVVASDTTHCVVTPPCGFDGTCSSAGACNHTGNGTACGSTCTGSTFQSKTCDGAGACQLSGSSSTCPDACSNNQIQKGTCTGSTCGLQNATNCNGNVICTNGACLAACTQDSDCLQGSSGRYCAVDGGGARTCTDKITWGNDCTADNQCKDGKCLSPQNQCN